MTIVSMLFNCVLLITGSFDSTHCFVHTELNKCEKKKKKNHRENDRDRLMNILAAVTVRRTSIFVCSISMD
jgi:hypothetical protein